MTEAGSKRTTGHGTMEMSGEPITQLIKSQMQTNGCSHFFHILCG